MTDITELAQSLKAAAEKATPGQWVAYTNTKAGTFAIHTPEDSRYGNVISWMGFDSVDMSNTKKSRNAKFIAMANPANILALVEALEKAQTERDEFRRRFNLERSILEDADKDLEELRQRIAELEGILEVCQSDLSDTERRHALVG